MYICGIDTGTTNAKGILLDENNKKLDSISYMNPSCEKVCWYDQFNHIMGYFSNKIGKGERTICGFATQGGSFVEVDKNYRSISPMNLWTQTCSQDTVDNYIKKYGKKQFYLLTGWAPQSWQPIFKIKEKSIIKKHKIAFVPEFVYAQLTDKFVTDITNAQITGIAEFENCQWNSELLAYCGLKREQLAKIESQDRIIFENVNSSWGRLDIAGSIHDQYTVMNAVNLRPDKDVMLATGTAWVLNMRTKNIIRDDKFQFHPGRDAATGRYGNIVIFGHIGKYFQNLMEKVGVSFNSYMKVTGNCGITRYQTRR